MKLRSNNKYFKWGLTAFLTIAACVLLVYCVFNFNEITTHIKSFITSIRPILIAIIIAYLLSPILNFFEYKVIYPICGKLKIKKTKKTTKIVRAIGITLTVISFLAFVGIIIGVFISQIVPSISGIIENYQTYYVNIYNWISKVLDDNVEIREYITSTLQTYSEQISDWITVNIVGRSTELIMTVSRSVVSGFKILGNYILGIFIAIYLMASKEKIGGTAKKIMYSMWENNTANVVINNLRYSHKTFINFFVGKIIDSIIVGVICFIVTAIMGIPYYALVSIIIGITNIIPVFGPFLGAIPSALLIFMVNPMEPMNVVYFLIMLLILQQLDGNVIGPKILGDSTGLASVYVLLAITFFGGIMGVLGMFLAVPAFAIFYAFIKSLVESTLKQKNMPTATECYKDAAIVDENGTFVPYVDDYKLKKRERGKNIYGTRIIANMREKVNDEEYVYIFEENIRNEEARAEEKRNNKLSKKLRKKNNK